MMKMMVVVVMVMMMMMMIMVMVKAFDNWYVFSGEIVIIVAFNPHNHFSWKEHL
jgi:hypothetical protein